MGSIFGGGDAADEINDAMQSQIDAEKAETARKISDLKEERLAVVKSQGSPQWTSSAPVDTSPSPTPAVSSSQNKGELLTYLNRIGLANTKGYDHPGDVT